MTKTFALLSILLAGPAVAAESPATTGSAAAAVAPATPDLKPIPAREPTPAPETSLVDMIRALSQFLTEDEIQLVYDYMWDSSIAAIRGDKDEVTLPPELAFKLAILQRRIVKEGGSYLQGLARKMDRDLSRYWQEKLMTPAPPVPYSLPSERGKNN